MEDIITNTRTQITTQKEARQQALDWQTDLQEKDMSYLELADAQEYFEKLADKFGLTDEFKENGII